MFCCLYTPLRIKEIVRWAILSNRRIHAASSRIKYPSPAPSVIYGTPKTSRYSYDAKANTSGGYNSNQRLEGTRRGPRPGMREC